MDRGDDEDFRGFVTTRSAALLRTAYLLTGDRNLAEDLLLPAYPSGPCADDRPPHPPVQVPALPEQRDVRGSLGGDPEVAAAVLEEGYAALLTEGPDARAGASLDPATARVEFVQRVDGRIAGAVTATDAAGRNGRAAWVTGVDTAHLRGHWNRAITGGAAGADPLPAAAMQEMCGHRYGMLAVRPGTTGRISWVDDVDADARVMWTSAAIPLRPDGIAVFGLPPGITRVELSGNQVADVGAGVPASLRPSAAEVRRAVAAAPGTADDAAVTELVFGQSNWIALPQHDLRVHWKGNLDGTDVVVASVAVPSGARHVWTAWSRGGRSDAAYAGLLPAGAVDRTVLAARVQGDGQPLVVFAPGAVRAELVTGDTIRSVALDAGGAVVPDGAGVTLVRAYGEGGQLIGERVPGTGLVPAPTP